MATLGQAVESKRNNFDIIRLVAALVVLVSHSYPLTGDGFEPFYHYLGGYDTGGGFAVSTFFVISGFLVTRSVARHDLSVYARSRALRILPALTFVILLQAFVLGPLVTDYSLAKYFASSKTYEHLKNISMFFRSSTLPGVFTENPLRSVNGSLWTLSIESAFYIALPALAFLGFLKPGRILLLLVATALAYVMATEIYELSWSRQGGSILPGLPLYSTLKEGLFFLSGAALWIWRDKVPLNPILALGLFLALCGFSQMPGRYYVFLIAIPYLVIYLSLAHPFPVRLYEKVGDLSYGVYIFAFPIQQSIVHCLGRDIGPVHLSLIAIPATLVMAFVTRVLVENPALRVRMRLPAARPLTPATTRA